MMKKMFINEPWQTAYVSHYQSDPWNCEFCSSSAKKKKFLKMKDILTEA